MQTIRRLSSNKHNPCVHMRCPINTELVSPLQSQGARSRRTPLCTFESCHPIMDLDSILKVVGECGLYQKILLMVICYTEITGAMYSMGYVFLSVTPTYWCNVPMPPGLKNLSREAQMNISIPWEKDTSGTCGYNHCKMYARNYTALSADDLHYATSDLSVTACTDWIYDQENFGSTTVTEWNLVCDREWMSKTIASAYVAGALVGMTICGQLSDAFGRKKVALVCVVLQQIFATVAAFSPTFLFFVAMRFLLAGSYFGMAQSSFIIVCETVGPRYRVIAGVCQMCVWVVGYLLVALIAYFVRDWVPLQLIFSLSQVVLFLYFVFLPESPRWLLSKGRHEEAVEILRKIAIRNGKQFPENATVTVEREEQSSNILLLFRKRRIRTRTLVLYFVWFASSFTYYGLSYNTSDLGGDIYLNFALSAAVEFPSYIVIIFAFQRVGRPFPLAISLLAASLFLFASIPVPQDILALKITLAMLGKFAISSSLTMIWIYTPELYPTLLRTTGLSTSSVCARIGGILGAYVFLLTAYGQAIPLVLFAGTGVIASVLTIVFLPETRGKSLPATVEQAEDFGRGQGVKSTIPCLKRQYESCKQEELATMN